MIRPARGHNNSRARSALALLCCYTVALVLTSCIKLPRRTHHAREQAESPAVRSETAGATRVNINTATREELEKLPGVGQSIAARIIEHRNRHGRFRRAEHLIMVRGISDRRFRELRELIAVE